MNDFNNDLPPLEPELGEDGTKITKEGAEESVNKLLDYYDIEFEDIVNDQGKEGARTWKNKIVRAFQKGRLELLEDPDKGFCIVQNFSTKKQLVYKEYGAIAAIQSAKQKDSETANLTLLASLSGNMVAWFKSRSNCTGPDLRLAEAIVMVFFF